LLFLAYVYLKFSYKYKKIIIKKDFLALSRIRLMNIFFCERGANVKFKHINSKKDSSFSLIIVPHSKDTKQVRVSSWVPKIISTLLIVSISVTGYLTWNLYNSYEGLKIDYSDKIDRLQTLESVNDQQRIEIDNLRVKTSEIEEKLKSITLLQETVKNMVGIKDAEKDSKGVGSATRGSSISSRYLTD